MSLMNKLITMTSEGKFSLIETVVDKLVKKQAAPKKPEEAKKEELPSSSASDDWTAVLAKPKTAATVAYPLKPI